jgi:hypothetical protein
MKKILAVASFLVPFAALAFTAPSPSYREGYNFGYDKGYKSCTQTPAGHGQTAMSVCGYNQRSPEDSPETREWINGCVEGYTAGRLDCVTNRSPRNTDRHEPKPLDPAPQPLNPGLPGGTAGGTR